ncbi:hypothetical protein [Microbulbifer sp. TYP-18]|uniref:hypothetical protein n=1 Tax=Microbulbifer sp. TYP-18 TaxID=3230024 RepID=UPI0034C5F78E
MKIAFANFRDASNSSREISPRWAKVVGLEVRASFYSAFRLVSDLQGDNSGCRYGGNLQRLCAKIYHSILSRLLKKASCLFQNTKSEKCEFHFSPKINDLDVVDFAGTSIFRYQASKFCEFQQPVRGKPGRKFKRVYAKGVPQASVGESRGELFQQTARGLNGREWPRPLVFSGSIPNCLKPLKLLHRH